jgi:meso-butanediol dehydrogenase / (S,S)-butanediol dehydrogenase / diacetyl reductase
MLNGKTILVTGATSGIGRATAEACAQAGARVVASGRNAAAGEDLIAGLAGAGHTFIAADLGDPDQAKSLFGKAASQIDRIDGLVNNAGVVHHASVPDTSDTDWDDTIAVNLSAVFYLCRAAIPIMISQGGGAIVNVASTWGLVGAGKSAAYCASKGAVVQLTRAMAMDHAGDNVRVNAVAPGAVDTPMLATEAPAFGLSVEECRELWAGDAPNRKLASAGDIAEAILFLVSDRSKHIHGVTLPVDGGSLAG